MKQRFEVGIPTCTVFLSAPSLQSSRRAGFSVSISKPEYGGPYFPRVYQPRFVNSGVRCGFLFGHQTVCCFLLASVLEERIVVSETFVGMAPDKENEMTFTHNTHNAHNTLGTSFVDVACSLGQKKQGVATM